MKLPQTVLSAFADEGLMRLKHEFMVMDFNGIPVETCYLFYQCDKTGERCTTADTDNCWVVDMVSGYLARGGKLSEVKAGWRNFWVHDAPLFSGKSTHLLDADAAAKEEPRFAPAYSSPGLVDVPTLRACLQELAGFILYYPPTHGLVAGYYPLNGKLCAQSPEFVSLGKLIPLGGLMGTLKEQQASLRKLFPGLTLFVEGLPSKRQLSRSYLERARLVDQGLTTTNNQNHF